jgi:SAM-dependent methyltransferase
VADGPRAGSQAWRKVGSLVGEGAAQDLVDSLDRAATQLRKRRLARLHWLDLKAGDSALDVGCGTGDLVIDLVDAIAPGVRGVGLDASTEMVGLARRRAADRGVIAEFCVGDAQSLEFSDGGFQGAHCTRVLMHLDRPDQAVAEMARVLWAGGRLVLSEPDWDAWILDADDRVTTTVVEHHLAERIRQPDVGRRLRRLAILGGLEVLDFRMELIPHYSLAQMDESHPLRLGLDDATAAGAVDADTGTAWWQSLVEADAKGSFFGASAVFTLYACKPA